MTSKLPIKLVPDNEPPSTNTYSVSKFIDEIDVFLFDCDGVVWHGNTLVPGTHKALKSLQDKNKKVYFVTNNSTKSRAGYLKKFWDLGLKDVVHHKDQIVCAAHATVSYLVKTGFKEGVKNVVYVIGESGLEEELSEAGIEWVGGTRDAGKTMNGPVLVDDRVGAVVVGLDRDFSYYKLQYAQICINDNKAKFIATNTDMRGHFDPTQACAGSGGMVGAVEGCTGVKPFVIGKPERHMIDMLSNTLPEAVASSTPRQVFSRSQSSTSHRMAMIGDRLDTDILFGVNAQITTVTAMTGITCMNLLKQQLVNAQQAIAQHPETPVVNKHTVMPDYYIDTITLFA